MLSRSAICAAALAGAATAEVIFKETFTDDWADRWTVSDWKKSSGTAGEWVQTAGKWYGDAEEGKGLQTSEDARFYAISSKLDETFNNKDKTLVLQFQVRHEQKIDCGGGYIKLHGPELDQANLSGDSAYNIMFGPDICGSSTKRVHAIFSYKGENHLIKKTVKCETDQLSHVYTLVVKPDQTYEIRIDGKVKESGSMLDDWDFLPEAEIKDPAVSKPTDWVDNALIQDPESVKPEGYDDIPETIPDPKASMPDDWDEEDDGEWEAPIIPNPEYKGEWTPEMIENPDYQGEWVHPLIANPEYELDEEIYVSDNGYIGFDLWQVKSGSIFDNIIVTDDIAEAEAFMAETYGKNKDAEKAMFDQIEKERKEAEAAEQKKQEEERRAAEEEEEEDEYDDEDDEDEEDEDDDEEEHDEL